MTVARIKQAWRTGCLTHVKGENVVPYCTCLYNHLSATGTFKTTTAVNGLLKKLHDYSKTGDPTTLPRAVQLALTVCAVKLPALAPIGTQPTLTRLPGLSHRRVPFPVIAKLPAQDGAANPELDPGALISARRTPPHAHRGPPSDRGARRSASRRQA